MPNNADGSGDVNEVAIAHYNAVIDDILEKGEQPASSVHMNFETEFIRMNTTLKCHYKPECIKQFPESISNHLWVDCLEITLKNLMPFWLCFSVWFLVCEICLQV